MTHILRSSQHFKNELWEIDDDGLDIKIDLKNLS